MLEYIPLRGSCIAPITYHLSDIFSDIMSGSDSPVYEFESDDGSDGNSDYEDYEDSGVMSYGAEKGNAAVSRSVVSALRIQMCLKHPPGK